AVSRLYLYIRHRPTPRSTLFPYTTLFRSMGLTGERVSTMNYSVSPEMQYPSQTGGTPKVTGYVVNNTVRADIQKIDDVGRIIDADRKSTRLNSSHRTISYAVFCLKKKKKK